MEHKKIILKDALNLAHELRFKLGIWWFQPATGRLEYSTKARGHLDRKYFRLRDIAIIDNYILRGRLFQYMNKRYLIIYSNDGYGFDFPLPVIEQLRVKVEAIAGLKIDLIINEKGELIK